MPTGQRVLVTGGAGYVGSVLVPKLLAAGYNVRVLDLYLYGEEALSSVRGHPNLEELKADIRDERAVRRAVQSCESVVHLACISNDPSFELDPELGKSINLEAFRPLVRAAKDAGVTRFIYASTSSVYGIKNEPDVDEGLVLEPLTDYSRYKAQCERILEEEREPGFATLTLRPATVCGYSPRLRLDVVVNILTSHAYHEGTITLFGGDQKRPNIHIEDMTDLYLLCLGLPPERIDGRTFNAGYGNHTLLELGNLVQAVVQKLTGRTVGIQCSPTDDNRSYHISSERLRRELGFTPKRTIEQAVEDLVRAFENGLVPDAAKDSRYRNIQRMREVRLR